MNLETYIEKETAKIKKLMDKIPSDTKDLKLTHKRATLAGNLIALKNVKDQIKKELKRFYEKH